MNKQAYRVIFNKNRGMLMAVAENVSSQGKGTGANGESGVTSSPLMRLVHLGVAIAALFGAVTVVNAQIVADPNAGSRRPTVDQTANGRPLVQITTPSAAGVSHNQYNQFNVAPNGAILNNARTVTQTQQGGYVDGNPNLANGGARIILNEVTGSGRSQLNGYTEVAGQRAEVIIANPNGITCSNCGFINTSRGALTTGTPVFGGDGSLNAFRVTRGDIQINGLNAANTDQLDLIARSVQVNGQLWANNLNVVTGSNQVNYADLGVQVIQGEGAKPTVGIDVSQLGGMYANKIRLIGTEAGVGVASLGNIAAQAGDLNIDSQGKVTLNGKTNASGRVTINTIDGVDNSGTLYSRNSTQISSAGQISNRGTIAAQSDLNLSGGSINSSGILAAGIDANGQATLAGNLNLVAGAGISATGQNTAGGNIAMDGASLNLAHAQTSANGSTSLTARAGNIDHTGANLQSAGVATLNASGAINNNQGRINVSQLSSNSASLSNTGGNIIQSGAGDTSIATSGALDNSTGAITTNAQNLHIQSGALNNTGGQINHAGSGAATIQSGVLTNVQGSIASNGRIGITASGLDNHSGKLTSAQQTVLAVSGDIANVQGNIQSGGALTVGGVNIDNGAGSIISLNAEGMTLNASGQLTNVSGGVIGGNGDLALTAANVVNSGKITASNNLTSTIATGFDNSNGRLAAGKNLTANAASLKNANGIIDAATVTLTVPQLDNTSGKITADQLNIHSNNLTNQHGQVIQYSGNAATIAVARTLDNSNGGLLQSNSNDLSLAPQTLINDGGTIAHAGSGTLTLDSAGAISNKSGNIGSNGQLALSAGSLNNEAGKITSAGQTTVRVAGDISNAQGLIQSAASLTMTGVNIDNSAGSITSLNADGMTFNASGQLTNASGGIIGGNGDVTLTAANAVNSGKITASNNLTGKIANTLDNSNGRLAAGNSLNANAANLKNVSGVIDSATVSLAIPQLDNTSGKITADQLAITSSNLTNRHGQVIQYGSTATIAVAGTLDNSNGGLLQTNSTDLGLTPQTLINDGGTIAHAGTGSLKINTGNGAGNLSNKSGSIGTNGQLALNAGSLNNQAGSITSKTQAVLRVAGDIDNAQGLIQAGGALKLSGANIDNSAGSITSLNADGMTLDASGQLINATAGIIGGNGDLTLTAASAINGGKITAANNLTSTIANSFDNSNGRLAAGKNLTANAASLKNANGVIDAATVALTIPQLDNTGGKITADQLAINSNNLTNQHGQVVQYGSNATTIAVAGTLDNSNGGLLQTNSADLSLTPQTLINDGGTIAHAGSGTLTINASNGNGTLSNKSGSIGTNGQLALNAGSLNNQAGSITSKTQANLHVNGDISNAQGLIQSSGALAVNGANIDNSAGNITSLNADGMTLNASGLLTNAAAGVIGGNGDVTLSAANAINGGKITASNNLTSTIANSFDNSNGRLAAGKNLNVNAASLKNANGAIDAATVALTIPQLDNASGKITADQLAITSSNLINQHGQVVQYGSNATTIALTGALDNSNGGLLQTNGVDMNLTSQSLNNDGGAIAHAGSGGLKLSSAGLVSNKNGSIGSNGQLAFTAGSLNNQTGSITSKTQANLHVGGDIVNAQGTIQSGTALTVSGANIDNSAGSITSLNADGLTLNASGQLTNAAGGVIGGNGDVALTAGSVVNSGKITASNNLTSTIANSLDNSNGRLAAGKNLNANAASLKNAGGVIDASKVALTIAQLDNTSGKITADQLAINSGNLTNQHGQIIQYGNNASTIAIAGTLDNSNGGLLQTGSTDLSLTPQTLNNDGGTIALSGNGKLTLNVGNGAGNLSNQGGSIGSNGQATISAASIANRGGSLFAQQQLAVTASQGGVDNSGGGYIGGSSLNLDAVNGQINNAMGKIEALQQAITLHAQSLNNAGGTVQGIGAAPLSITTSQGIDNTVSNNVGGFIGGSGTVSLNAGSFDNSGGTVYGKDNLNLQSNGVLTNANGVIQGAASVNASAAGAINNGNGRIEANGSTATLTVSGTSIDNTAGRIANSGAGLAQINGGGQIVSHQGTIGGNGDVGINTTNFDNSQQGKVVATGNLTLASNALNNNAGTLYAAQNLQFNQSGAALTNVGGNIGAAGNISVSVASINNIFGLIGSTAGAGSNIALSTSSDLNNIAGTVASGRNLSINANTIVGNGKVIAGQDATINLQGDYANTAGNTLTANHNLSLTTTGNLTNTGTLTSVNGLTVSAANVDNQASGLINAGATTILAANAITNTGRIYGDDIAIGAQSLTNDIDLASGQAGAIAARNSINIGAASVINREHAIIQSLGDMTFGRALDANRQASGIADSITNSSATIDAGGKLTFQTAQLNNLNAHFTTAIQVDPSKTKHVTLYNPWYDSTIWYTPDQLTWGDSGDGGIVLIDPTGGRYEKFSKREYDQTVSNTVVTRSDPGKISSGSGMVLSGNITNDKSTIIAGGTLSGTTGNINNIGATGETDTVNHMLAGENYYHWVEGHPHQNHYTYENNGAAYDVVQPTTPLDLAVWSVQQNTAPNSSGNPALGQGVGSVNVPTVGGIALSGNLGGQTIAGGARGVIAAGGSAGGNTGVGGSSHDITAAGGSAGGNTGVGGSNHDITAAGGTAGGNTGVGGSNQGVAAAGGKAGSDTGAGGASSTIAAAGGKAGAGTSTIGSNQTIGSAGNPLPNLALPNNRLFTIQANPGQHYLVETDPVFTGYKNFISSDYMLGRLSLEPQKVQKRLGDGFYEQKMVTDQVMQLTGRRTLSGYASAEDEFKGLMDSGIANAKQFNIAPGMALSDAQMAALTSDIVWLVNQTVTLPDGSKTQVLAPVVYLARANASDLKMTGALISGQDIDLTVNGTLKNGGTLQASSNMIIQATDIANTGNIRSTGKDGATLLVAQNNILNDGGNIQGHRVGILAGRDVTLATNTVSIDNQEGHTSTLSRVAGVTADQLSIAAGRDLTIQAAQINATGDAQLSAGRDLQLTAVTTQKQQNLTYDRDNHLYVRQTQVSGTQISTGGNLTMAAGRDLTATAVTANAGGQVVAVAGRDITLAAAQQETTGDRAIYTTSSGMFSSSSSRSQDNRSSTTAIGNSLTGNAITIQSGRDTTVQGSQVIAKSDLNINAGRDLNIVSAQQTSSDSFSAEEKKSGFSGSFMTGVSFGNSGQNQKQNGTSVTQVGSDISGANIHTSSGRDTTITASAVTADKDVGIYAGRDINVLAAANTQTSQSDSHSSGTSFGVLGGANFRFTNYSQVSAAQNGSGDSTVQSTSLISANGGNLSMQAGLDKQYQGTGHGNVTTQGAELIAKDKLSIAGNAVDLQAIQNSSSSQFHAETHSVTLGSSLTGAIGGALTSIGDAVTASQNTSNDRLKGALALKAGYDAYKLAGALPGAVDAAKGSIDTTKSALDGVKEDPSKAGAGAGFGISVNLGTSQSKQDSKNSATQARGTTAQAGSIDITAREGDINMEGTKLQAQNIALDAAKNINLIAAKNTTDLQSSNSGSSVGIGATLGSNGQQTGLSFQIGASVSKGHANGSETTYDNTQISATNQLSVKSGGDLNLKGAQLAGNKVTADIGGNMNIWTLQDKSNFDSKQENGGFSLSICVPPICVGQMVSGSVSYAKQTVDHNYQSAVGQSGIAAGSDGFDIRVKGNTDLKGAGITSTASADKNSLQTASLTTSDLTNSQHTKSESVSVSASTGSIASNVLGNVLGNLNGSIGMPKNGDQSSSTNSVISPATVTITGSGDAAKDAQSQANATTLTSRDAATANATLANTLTLQQAQELQVQQQKAQENQRAAGLVGSVLANVVGDVAKSNKWPDGSPEKIALHGMVGLIEAKIGGGNATAGAAAGMGYEAMVPVMSDYLVSQGYKPGTQAFNDMMNLGATLVGAASGALAGGSMQSAAAGANVGLVADRNNRALHDDEKVKIKAKANGNKAEEDRLTKAACYEVKCWAQYQEGSAAYNANYVGVMDAYDLKNEISWVKSQQTLGQFVYSTPDKILDNVFSTHIPVALNGLKVVTGWGTATAGVALCETGAGCLVGAPMTAFGSSNMMEGGNALYNAYIGNPAMGVNPLRYGFNQAMPAWGNTAYDTLNLVATLASFTVPVPKMIGASDGIDRAKSIFGSTTTGFNNVKMLPFSNLPYPYGVTQAVMVFGVGSQGVTVVNDVSKAGGNK
ncbi:hemagglutinin repeat-containing protein [Collimonas antrihumi]|uniref:hemagglutinin repeat-containing protein n=1 Tax=Collimonas antrihumi TaxID=1940615 RepID=UPI001B8AEA16|nr:hemagglutinin repeat-containing protein [Collimonas antrihumi]